jgi:isopentenyl-diphosphate Delta-isomerase
MSKNLKSVLHDNDPSAESRKKDHIELAFQSQVNSGNLDRRFYYEPLLAAHPKPGSLPPLQFLGKTLHTPIWVSSMTGGTQLAGLINKNLAKACAEFGMGMGLGSCRSILSSDKHLHDFQIRNIIGPDLPLYANLGIAQIEKLLFEKSTDLINNLLQKLQVDGLIIHVNPLQEWLQPEGDLITRPPIESIAELLESANYPVIVKEVGQGFGPASMDQLLRLPLAAIDFAASGGTNFSVLELLRADEALRKAMEPVAHIGHDATEMVQWLNIQCENIDLKCRQVIISGGVRDFLDGYYLTELCKLPAVYGQASSLLKYARGDYNDLKIFLQQQIRGLELAHAYLKIR